MNAPAHVEVEHRFAMIPETLLYDDAISPDAVRVYGVLVRHGSDPENCYPSHARIGGLIGRSKRSIATWISELETAGWVERVARLRPDGSPDSNGYRVLMIPRQPEERVPQRGVHASQGGGVPVVQRGPSTLDNAPKESQVKESHEERENDGRAAPAGRLDLGNDPVRPAPLPGPDVPPAAASPMAIRQSLGTQRADGPVLGSDRDLAFVAFWDVYPRKAGKGQARKAWAAARRRHVPPEVMVRGAMAYAADPNREDAYTKHPATWLNGECWGDDALPDRRVAAVEAPRTAMGRTMGHLRGIAVTSARTSPTNALEAPR